MSFDLKITGFDLSVKSGKIDIVEGTEKLIQDILKICLTEVGSNPLNSGYGSYISKSVVGNVMETKILTHVAQSHLNSALENLKKLQDMQSRSYQRVSAEEQIASILSISVDQNANNPTLFDVRIAVASKAFNRVSTDFNINMF